jgi:hypothetical protein
MAEKHELNHEYQKASECHFKAAELFLLAINDTKDQQVLIF